jgi:hypothetical protein
MRNEFLSSIIELKEMIEAHIGEISEFVNKTDQNNRTSSRRLAVF